MRVLLFNDNPVVTKLVTLSTQKTGDELEVCSNVEEISFNECDLLIIDDELYNDESILALEASVNAKKYLFMSKRGVEKPANFDYSINKPFLPTDLVELFSAISSSLSSTNSEDETFELDDFDDNLILEEDDSETLELDTDDIESIEIDDVEVDDEILLDLDSFEEEESSSDSVLDKDDLAEVQSLLDDTEEKDDATSIGDLDDIDGLEIDDTLFEDEISEAEDITQSDELENITLDDDLNMEQEEEETLSEELDASLDDISEEILSEELEDSLNDAIKEESLSDLEDEIKNAVSELSDEELEEDIDEETLLDIVNNDDELGNFSSLDDLDEHSLKVAVGEAEESIIDTSTNTTSDDALNALKTLLKALESDNVAESLKGMNININISFGDKN